MRSAMCSSRKVSRRRPLAAESGDSVPAPSRRPRGVAARCIRERRVLSSGVAEPPDEGLDAAIAALWRDAQPRALERVEVLEAAVAALAAGALDADAAAEATREAHKLAGALGTFGMPSGTIRARAIEQRLTRGVTAADAGELGEGVAALRAIVESGPGAG